MSAGKGGASVKGTLIDATKGYIVLIAVVAVFFGQAMAVDLGRVIVQAIAVGFGSLVTEIPDGADTVKAIQGASPDAASGE